MQIAINGAKLVDQAGATMKEIVESVNRVTGIMGEISVAGKEQTEGFQQVNQAINQMDEVTQQNAALVEEAAAAASSLQDQAVSLAHVVSVFKLAEMEAAPAAGDASAVGIPASVIPLRPRRRRDRCRSLPQRTSAKRRSPIFASISDRRVRLRAA